MSEGLTLIDEKISLELKLLKKIGHISFNYEVDLGNGFKFSKYLLIFLYIHRMNDSAYPSDEHLFFLFRGQERHILIHFKVHSQD